MTTKTAMIKILETENPTLRIGNEQTGYTNLSAEDYECTISQWADNRLAKEQKLSDYQLAKQAKEDAAKKLTELGIDPKALGL